LIIYRQ